MNKFYEILDLLYQLNKKYPDISFGCLIDNLTLRSENLFYLSEDEIIKRIKVALEEE
jgi:hypothetical protein